MNYIISKLKKIKYLTNFYIKDDLNIFNKAGIYFDLLYSMIRYGAGITDYFQYEFYKKKHIERKKFIVYRKRMKIVKYFNSTSGRNTLDDKMLFNQEFKDFIGRDWLASKNMNYDEFLAFISKHNKFIFKPINGSHGKGIEIIDTSISLSIMDIYNSLKMKDAILEEIIVQIRSISEFNPSSINSLRVVTLVPNDGVPKLMTGNFRVGRGNKIADNFHHQGIASLIDIETGIVVTKGIDSEGEQFLHHPISKKQILGFEVPYWDAVKETVLKAALVLPEVRYIGWDIAIGENGRIIIIEGNAAADPDITQIPDKVGKWNLYEKYINF